MQINDNNSPWGTHALTFSQDEFCPFRTTRCLRKYRKCRKSFKRFKRFSKIPFKDSLRSNPPCQTLSKAFEIYLRKIPSFQVGHQTTYISWVMAINWLAQQSLGLNPGWLGEIKLLSLNRWYWKGEKRWKAHYKWHAQKLCCRLEVKK